MVNGTVNTEIIWDFQLRLSVKNDNISNVLIKDCNRKKYNGSVFHQTSVLSKLKQIFWQEEINN